MGFWSDLGNALVGAIATTGDIQQTIEALKERPKHEWTRILETAMDRAEERGDLDSWTRSFSQQLVEAKEQHPQLNGVHTVMLAVVAQRALRKSKS